MVAIGDCFRLGEVWISPRGMLWKVVDIDNDHRPRQAILRQGAAGRGRKIRRDWDAVINWALSPTWEQNRGQIEEAKGR